MNARLTSFDPSYDHTLPSDAGRELPEKGRTVDLRSVTVEVVVENDANDRSGFEFTFTTNHEQNTLTMSAVEPQYEDHAPAAELAAGADLADDAVHAWMLDVNKEFKLRNPITSAGVSGRAAVHTNLEVSK